MNDKWFNVAMIIVFTSLLANGFVLMLTSFPNGSNYSNLYQKNLDYNADPTSMKATYKDYTNTGDKMTKDTTDAYTPITLAGGDPFGLAPLGMLVTAFLGLELMLLSLANIFPMFAIMFGMVILVIFSVKAIVVAYFASMLIRFIFGGRQ